MADVGTQRDSVARARAIIERSPSIDLHSHLGHWQGKGLTDVFDLDGYKRREASRRQ